MHLLAWYVVVIPLHSARTGLLGFLSGSINGDYNILKTKSLGIKSYFLLHELIVPYAHTIRLFSSSVVTAYGYCYT